MATSLVVFVVSEQLDHDGAPIKGVFLTREAAKQFVKLRKLIDPFDDYFIERWAVEDLPQVRSKFKSFKNRKPIRGN